VGWGNRIDFEDVDMRRGRQRPDKITARESYANPVSDSIFHSVQTLDRVVVKMDEKWGVDRLPALVSSETASRFGSAKAKLDFSLEENNDVEVARRCAVLLRGYKAMDSEAERLGREPMNPEAWVWRDDDGKPFAFVRESAEAISYGKANPGVAVFTMGEISRLAAIFQDETEKIGTAAKIKFPGAEIVRIDGKVPSDEIPF
tara:strand:+ start:892 stop:1497 length:606 start_codon:yes stop_codon:yes gene_type:complete